MKIGIYIPGLGQSFQQESVVKYATRLMNELRYNKTGAHYELKTEKIHYSESRESTAVSIIETNGEESKPIYKIYDFQYSDILTSEFCKSNILIKNVSLFLLTVKKFPLLVLRLFKRDSHSRPFQTFYIFFLFFTISLAILFMIPACIELVSQFNGTEVIGNILPQSVKNMLKGIINFLHIDIATAVTMLKSFLPITTVLLIIAPEAKLMVTTLASEFVCINNYLELGTKSQSTLGNLDLLVEYIAEKEKGSKIHFHTYSLGTIIALDYLFPRGNVPSNNLQELSEVLITIGSPYEVINAYYPGFYDKRNSSLEDKLYWINVYSISDALATNFRNDAKVGNAEFGLSKSLIPHNLNYEVAALKKFNLFAFFTLYHIHVHSMYWDPALEGQSCLRLINNEMQGKKLF